MEKYNKYHESLTICCCCCDNPTQEHKFETYNYEELENKPRINDIILVGNLTREDLGLIIPTNLSDFNNDVEYITKSYIDDLVGDINSILDNINDEVI